MTWSKNLTFGEITTFEIDFGGTPWMKIVHG